MIKKRNRMALNSKEMPDDVYQILNEKALKRNLTSYIIDLVKKEENDKLILERLDNISEYISRISSKVYVKSDMEDNIIEEKRSLKEGMIINEIKEVTGELDQEDTVDYDY
ncbi:hypothetical protein ACJDU8_10845 [Clostridium sp. WILCCON 0269]|uniref:Uncharacterized protein n=1 Tax=Candidatus Clostridium eludens TaxID=3381663 RepID=A0ABW8SLK3_9CLOT